MPPPDEEAIDAQLETLQQKITLTLQAIDQNFARCNQILSGEILPEVDRFSDATRSVYEGNQIWLHFLHSFEHSSGHKNNNNNNSTSRSNVNNITHSLGSTSIATNRPPFPSAWQQSTESSPGLSNILHRPQIAQISSLLSESSASAIHRLSPPRTIPFGLSPTQLQKTPAREAARLMIDDYLITANARSTPSTPSSWRQGGQNDFERFASRRRQRYREMEAEDELPRIARTIRSPNSRRRRQPGEREDDTAAAAADPLISTPTAQRIIEEGQDLVMSPSVQSEATSIATAATTEVQFSLQHFPKSFQIPPGSTKLTHVYGVFQSRPDTILTMAQLERIVPDYDRETLELMVNLLTRKKFLRKNEQGWMLRTH
ncbi:hypothetical protein BX666DRAFT_545330 [Dichotomocladium elegans]|nr:hypothetical protein BX666DRAFT_545330 [Dichotomocladium elegans]